MGVRMRILVEIKRRVLVRGVSDDYQKLLLNEEGVYVSVGVVDEHEDS